MLRVAAIAPDSLGAELGLAPGDELLAINGRELVDFLDWEFLAADEAFLLSARTVAGEAIEFDIERPEDRREDLDVERLELRRIDEDVVWRDDRAHEAVLRIVGSERDLHARLREVRAQMDRRARILQMKMRPNRARCVVVEVYDLPGHRPPP